MSGWFIWAMNTHSRLNSRHLVNPLGTFCRDTYIGTISPVGMIFSCIVVYVKEGRAMILRPGILCMEENHWGVLGEAMTGVAAAVLLI